MSEERELLVQYVATWRRAGAELEAIRAEESRTVDLQLAIRQIFGDSDLVQRSTRLTTSGLVEQQAWFAKLRK